MVRSEKYLTWRNCGRKKKFYTSKTAKKAIQTIKNQTGRQFYYYRCLNCGGWHITKIKQEKMARH